MMTLIMSIHSRLLLKKACRNDEEVHDKRCEGVSKIPIPSYDSDVSDPFSIVIRVDNLGNDATNIRMTLYTEVDDVSRWITDGSETRVLSVWVPHYHLDIEKQHFPTKITSWRLQVQGTSRRRWRRGCLFGTDFQRC